MRKYCHISILGFILIACSNNQEEIRYLEYKVDSVSNLLYESQNSCRFGYIMQLDLINPDIAVIDKNLDTCKLGQVTKNSDRLYFHYCDIHCSVCLDKQLTMLQEFESKNGSHSLCIIGSVQSYRTW